MHKNLYQALDFTIMAAPESDILAFKTQKSAKEMWITEAGFGTWLGNNSQQFEQQMIRMIRTSRYWSKGLRLFLY